MISTLIMVSCIDMLNYLQHDAIINQHWWALGQNCLMGQHGVGVYKPNVNCLANCMQSEFIPQLEIVAYREWNYSVSLLLCKGPKK